MCEADPRYLVRDYLVSKSRPNMTFCVLDFRKYVYALLQLDKWLNPHRYDISEVKANIENGHSRQI